MPPRFSKYWLAALAVLALLLAFVGSDVMSLKGCDEGFYAQIAKEMAVSGDWLTLHFNGQADFEKPPLVIWLVALSFRLGGVGDFQARLPVLVIGVLSVLVVARIAWNERRDPALSFWAGAIVATTALFMQLSHQVMMDVPALCFFAVLVLALLSMRRDRRYGWLIGPNLGLILLTKGALCLLLVAALVPFLVRFRPKATLPLLIGLLVGLLPAVAWYGWMQHLYGAAFWRVHLGEQVIARSQTSLFGHDPLGPGFYLVHMTWSFLPWSFLVPSALIFAWRRMPTSDPLVWFSLSFGGVFLLGISLMQTKFDHYALPLLIPVALLLADWIVSEPRARHAWVALPYLALGSALLVAVGLVAAHRVVLPVVHPLVLLEAVGLLALTFLGTAQRLLSARRPMTALPGLLAGTLLSFLFAEAGFHPWDAAAGLREVTAALPAHMPVVYVSKQGPGADFESFAAARFRVQGPFTTLLASGAASARKGWYLGRSDQLKTESGDRLVGDSDGWRLLERP